MKNRVLIKWFLAYMICVSLLIFPLGASAEPSYGDLIRFIPTIITVDEESVLVEGFFVNLNDDIIVKNFTDLTMEVYYDGDLLISGEFGDINRFSIQPFSVKFQSFTFNGEHNLNIGAYDCSDLFYVAVTCGFTAVDS